MVVFRIDRICGIGSVSACINFMVAVVKQRYSFRSYSIIAPAPSRQDNSNKNCGCFIVTRSINLNSRNRTQLKLMPLESTKEQEDGEKTSLEMHISPADFSFSSILRRRKRKWKPFFNTANNNSRSGSQCHRCFVRLDHKGHL